MAPSSRDAYRLRRDLRREVGCVKRRIKLSTVHHEYRRRGKLKHWCFDAQLFRRLQRCSTSAVLTATKLSAALPSDINFHRSIDSEFAQAIDDCSERALRLTNKLLDLAGSARGGKGRDKGNGNLRMRRTLWTALDPWSLTF